MTEAERFILLTQSSILMALTVILKQMPHICLTHKERQQIQNVEKLTAEMHVSTLALLKKEYGASGDTH